MAHNAKAGGEIGANGEFYKGGQFVADSVNTIKGVYLSRGPRKINVEPYKWIMAEPNVFGIWGFLDRGTYRYGADRHLMPVSRWYVGMEKDPDYEFRRELLKLYQQGERTIDVVDLANLRKTTNAGPYWITNKLDVREFATV